MRSPMQAKVIEVREELPPNRKPNYRGAEDRATSYWRVLNAEKKHRGKWCLVRTYHSASAARDGARLTFPHWFGDENVEFASAPAGDVFGVWCRWPAET